VLPPAFNKLARHDIRRWALTGGFAFEIHALRLGLNAPARPWNDLDFVVPGFNCIPETLADDFLFRHVRPFDPPGKTLLQFIDPDSCLRIDVFRACGETMRRAAGVVSLEDLVARAARLLLDLAEGIPVASKHACDYLRFVDLVNAETAWQDHRKPPHAATFREADRAIRDLIRAHPNLLITPEYSKNPDEICPRCRPTSAFQLADPNVVLALLGYC
jgi:hypothetical protein